MPTDDDLGDVLETEDTPFYIEHRVFAPCTPYYPLSRERYRQAITHIRCTRESLDALSNGETSSRLTAALSDSSLIRWKKRGFAQHLTLFFVPSATADNQPNVVLSFVYTKNWAVSKQPLAVFHLARLDNDGPHFKDVVDQLMRQSHIRVKIFCKYIYHHEQQCRVLKTQQQLDTERASLNGQMQDVWQAVRSLRDTHETTQRNTENKLQQHASLLGHWHISNRTSQDTMAYFNTRLQELQDDCLDVKDRLTAQARITEIQQDHICSARADRKEAYSAVEAFENKHNALQMTFHADIEARAKWTAHLHKRVLLLETQLARQTAQAQDVQRVILQNHEDTRWLCMYLSFACGILYQCMAYFGGVMCS